MGLLGVEPRSRPYKSRCITPDTQSQEESLRTLTHDDSWHKVNRTCLTPLASSPKRENDYQKLKTTWLRDHDDETAMRLRSCYNHIAYTYRPSTRRPFAFVEIAYDSLRKSHNPSLYDPYYEHTHRVFHNEYKTPYLLCQSIAQFYNLYH